MRGPGFNLIALWVWLYCLGCFVIQDAIKVAVFAVLYRLNSFNIGGARAPPAVVLFIPPSPNEAL